MESNAARAAFAVARVLGDALAAVGGQVEIAPVDAQVVAALGEHRLLARADAQERQAIELEARSGRRLVRGVDHQVGRGVEVDLHLVILAIGGGGGPLQIGERAREHVEIVGQRRREEGEPDVGAGAGEFVDGAGGRNFHARLRQFGGGLPLAAHDPVGLAVDPRIGGERVRLAGPVFDAVAVQVVGRRPDAEIGIVGHQRDRGRTHLREGGKRAHQKNSQNGKPCK